MDLRCIRSIVEDFGIGIANYIRDRILDPILTLKPKGEGTGLGLSITYGMVKDHGGKLIVGNTHASYTRFHVDLPVNNG
jgi:signal transduction histidine kinase